MAEIPYPLLLAALAWSAIVGGFVIHFFKESDEIYKRVIDGGAMALAVSHLESTQLLPLVAALVERVVEERAERQKAGVTPTYQDVLEEVEFKETLARSQVVLRKISKLDRDYTDLVDTAGYTWRWGALHILAIMATTLSYIFVTASWRGVLVFMLGAAAVLTLIFAIISLVAYDRMRSDLMRVLKDSRGA